MKACVRNHAVALKEERIPTVILLEHRGDIEGEGTTLDDLERTQGRVEAFALAEEAEAQRVLFACGEDAHWGQFGGTGVRAGEDAIDDIMDEAATGDSDNAVEMLEI